MRSPNGRKHQSTHPPLASLALSPPRRRSCSGGHCLAELGTKAPFFAIVIIETIITASLRKRTDAVFNATEHALQDLQLLSALLARLEREQFASPACRPLRPSSPLTISLAPKP